MSGTVCCYVGCKKSYSTHKDISFFKFPDDPKRRKIWMKNSGNVELESLAERQLRGKRICSDHFVAKSFQRPESKTTLTDSAVPIVAKVSSGQAKPPQPTAAASAAATPPTKTVDATPQKRGRGRTSTKPEQEVPPTSETEDSTKESTTKNSTPAKRRKLATPVKSSSTEEKVESTNAQEESSSAAKSTPEPNSEKRRSSPARSVKKSLRNSKPEVENKEPDTPTAPKSAAVVAKKSAPPPPTVSPEKKSPPKRGKGRQSAVISDKGKLDAANEAKSPNELSVANNASSDNAVEKTATEPATTETVELTPAKAASASELLKRKGASPVKTAKIQQKKTEPEPAEPPPQKHDSIESPKSPVPITPVEAAPATPDKKTTVSPKKRTKSKGQTPTIKPGEIASLMTSKIASVPVPVTPTKEIKQEGSEKLVGSSNLPKPKTGKKDLKQVKPKPIAQEVSSATPTKTPTQKSPVKPSAEEKQKQTPNKSVEPTAQAKDKAEVSTTSATTGEAAVGKATTPLKTVPSTNAATGVATGVTPKKKKKAKLQNEDDQIKVSGAIVLPTTIHPVDVAKLDKKRKIESAKDPNLKTNQATAKIIADQVSQMHSVLLPSNTKPRISTPSKLTRPVMQKVEISDNVSEADSYDEYMYFDRDFEETCYEDDAEGRLDRDFERFYSSLKKFLHLSGKWTMGGVQWDPQGRRKVIIISEPEIPPNGRPCVKRCLQFFEDKAIRVFIDGMDMTDVFGMTCYAEKEDVASLICRVAEASSCCGVPEMVVDDLIHFPEARKRNTSYFDSACPGVIPNDSYDPMCSSCKHLQELVMESRRKEKQRLFERRIRSEEKDFQHPFGKALYSMFSDLVDETDPSKPKKKRTKETFFRKYLHDTRYKMDGDNSKTERVYIEKPISVDSVSASFQDIVSKLGFNMANSKNPKTYGSALPRPPTMTSTPRPTRVTPSSSSTTRVERKVPVQMEHIQFSAGSSFTLDDGQEYELIGEVDPAGTEIVEMKPTPAQQQYEIIEVDDETLAKLASAKNSVVVLPEAAASSSNLHVTRIDANDPNLSQILKAINTSHGYK